MPYVDVVTFDKLQEDRRLLEEGRKLLEEGRKLLEEDRIKVEEEARAFYEMLVDCGRAEGVVKDLTQLLVDNGNMERIYEVRFEFKAKDKEHAKSLVEQGKQPFDSDGAELRNTDLAEIEKIEL